MSPQAYNSREVWGDPMPVAGGTGVRASGSAEGMVVGLRQDVEQFQRLPPAVAPVVATTHPFKVTKAGGGADLYRVQGGTCEGFLIPTEIVDVGGGRPVAILAYPQFNLVIEGGQYVHAITVKGGANAPVLEVSGSTFGDVAYGITAAGTQARALIAVITDSGITQIAMGNIVATLGDDQSRTAKAQGYFNKNY